MNAHFNLLAPVYDRVIPFIRLDQMRRVLDLPCAGSLLDAGGGTGRVGEALRPYVDWVVVADVSRGMLAQARQKELSVTSTQTEHLPFPDDVFNRVLMVDALHHVIHQGETIRELCRVLKAGGRLVIEEPDVRKFAVKLIAVVEKLALMRSRFLKPSQIVNLFPPEADVWIESEDNTAWVIAEKRFA
jgi:demethylmenaquinone methyltransferase/2-methoxy-6-polyprenyl-1,4-benzoquinol methylase